VCAALVDIERKKERKKERKLKVVGKESIEGDTTEADNNGSGSQPSSI